MKLEIGNEIIIGKKIEVKAVIKSINKKVRIRREDRNEDTYVYEKDIVRVVDKSESKQTKKPKYVSYITESLVRGSKTITELCKGIKNSNSKTGFIRPSQLNSSLRYLVDNNKITKKGFKYERK